MASDESIVHRLYLIRHGETVDNVAGLYAGVRDSALTNHGVQQASRLGACLAQEGVQFSHVFSSDLRRAVKTAELIRTSQEQPLVESTTQVKELREQDFGSYEGKPFAALRGGGNRTDQEAYRDDPRNTPGFQDVESKSAMASRADNFLDTHLMPILTSAQPQRRLSIAVVSHGILLSTLWRCLLRRQPPNSVSLDSQLAPPASLEHLGGWSNTGYLELELRAVQGSTTALSGPAATTSETAVYAATQAASKESSTSASALATAGIPDFEEGKADFKSEQTVAPATSARFQIHIKVINGKEHLRGLKRTGGGVGSSMYDEGQKSIHSFFKKRKT